MIESLSRHHRILPVEDALARSRVDIARFLRGTLSRKRLTVPGTHTGAIKALARKAEQ